MSLYLARVGLTLNVRVPSQVLDRQAPAPAHNVGKELARQVSQYVRLERLGYYPALAFFREHGGVDPSALETADNIAWLAAQLTREEVQLRLRPIFSSVQVGSLHCAAFSMPAVRPSQPDALERLAEHYTPDTVRVELVVTLFQRREKTDGMAKFARHTISRWLGDAFANLSVTSSRVL